MDLTTKLAQAPPHSAHSLRKAGAASAMVGARHTSGLTPSSVLCVAHSFRKADAALAIVKDGVVGAEEDVAKDPEGPRGHVEAEEAADALLLPLRPHLHAQTQLLADTFRG